MHYCRHKAIVCAQQLSLSPTHVRAALDAVGMCCMQWLKEPVGASKSTFFSCMTFPWQLCPQDFLIMFLHHVATISLITFSYVNNMARVGTLVMCLHDAADVLIEVRTCERIKCCGWTDGKTEWKMVGCVGGVFAQAQLSIFIILPLFLFHYIGPLYMLDLISRFYF